MKLLGLIFYFLILIAMVVFGVYFAKYNAYGVDINFLGFESFNTPLWIAILLAFFVGFILSAIVFSWKIVAVYLSKQQYIKSYEQVKKLLEQRVKDTKTEE
jgi:uncharacterized integral membrane protein